MKWTTDKPTRPGWYWAMHPKWKGPIVLEVGILGSRLMVSSGTMFDGIEHKFFDLCKWAGPIPEPEDQDEDC